MFSLELSTPAKEYFENLKVYLVTNFSEETKQDVLLKEKEKLESLKSFPYMGHDATKFSSLLDGYYVLTDKKEYLFYRVDEVEKIISIELILSTKEDIIQKIKKYFE